MSRFLYKISPSLEPPGKCLADFGYKFTLRGNRTIVPPTLWSLRVCVKGVTQLYSYQDAVSNCHQHSPWTRGPSQRMSKQENMSSQRRVRIKELKHFDKKLNLEQLLRPINRQCKDKRFRQLKQFLPTLHICCVCLVYQDRRKRYKRTKTILIEEIKTKI